MTSTPKISIIIPIYNAERYLCECLDSVINQTLKDIEIICINDGSTDGSEAILASYAKSDQRIKVINKKNAGYGAGMNDGLKEANGEFVGIVEPDDWISADMYHQLYSVVANDPTCDIVKAGWCEHDDTGNVIERLPYANMPQQRSFNVRAYPDILHWHPSTPMGIYRRSLLEEHDIRYIEAPGAGWVDNPFFIAVFYFARSIRVINKAYYHYRVGNFDHSSVLRDCTVPMRRIIDMFDFLDTVGSDYLFRISVEKRALVYLKRTLNSPYYASQRDEARKWITRALERIDCRDVASRPFDATDRKLYTQFSKSRMSRPSQSSPMVSIAIPVYNVDQYVSECLQSVVTQSLDSIEIICIDDGSSDMSRAILNAYADKDDRIIVHCQPHNAGYGAAMNAGLKLATGKYFGIVEPDDFISASMYELLVQTAEGHHADICKADFYRFVSNESGDMSLEYQHVSDNLEDYNQPFVPKAYPGFFRFKMNTVPAIYLRSLLAENDIRYNETPGASYQDNGFYLKSSLVSQRTVLVATPVYFIRRDNPNSSVMSKEKVYCMDEEYRLIRDWLEAHSLWDVAKEVWCNLLFRNALFTLNRIDESYKIEYAKHIASCFTELRETEGLSFSEFTDREKSVLCEICADPRLYCKTHLANQQMSLDVAAGNAFEVAKLRQEVERYRTSNSFKIGRIVTYIPRKIKRIIKKIGK